MASASAASDKPSSSLIDGILVAQAAYTHPAMKKITVVAPRAHRSRFVTMKPGYPPAIMPIHQDSAGEI